MNRNSNVVPVAPDAFNNDSFYLKESLSKYFFHWPLFIIGVLLSFSVAFFYLRLAHPVYTLTASVIIKDEKKEPSDVNNLQQLYLSNSSKLVENEIEVLGSRNLIAQVVINQQLWVRYEGTTEQETIALYNKKPVNFKLIRATGINEAHIINVKFKDDKSFYVKTKRGAFQEFCFNSDLKNSFGVWQLSPASTLNEFAGKEIKIVISSPEKVAQQYQNSIRVEQPNKVASTLTLTLDETIEERGSDILNGLIAVYNNASIAEKNNITKRTLDFIDNRILSLSGELNTSEKNIEGYRSSKGIANISSQSQVYLENVQANDSKLNEVNVQLGIIEGIDKYLNSAQNIQSVPSTIGIDDPLLNTSIEKLSALQLQREKLLATTPETNPDFEPIERQINIIKRSIKENIGNTRSSLLLTRDKLESFNSKYETSIKALPQHERLLVDKTRQQSIKENLYVYLLQKREEVSLNYSSILSDARIVDYAYLNKSSTRKPVIYALAFLAGILIPAGIIFGKTSLNNRIVSATEIEKGTGMSILGELSYVNKSSSLLIPDKTNNVICEDFRKLRTNLNLLKGNKEGGWITLITSSISGEGKSFLSANLGYFLALSGKKTIIFEMDWRRPGICQLFGLTARHSGVTDFLLQRVPIHDLIQNSKIQADLDIIGSGSTPSNPSEMLESEGISSLLAWARLNYDHIIIDTPPVNLVTDAKVLSKFSDTTLYIIRQNYTYKSLFKFIRTLTRQDPFQNMQIIFNGIEKGKFAAEDNYENNYYDEIYGSRKDTVSKAVRSLLYRVKV